MAKWSSDFPLHSSLTYEEISSLSSRSRDIGKWFKRISEEFVLYKEAPAWFLDAGKDANDWSREIQSKYAYIKTLNKEFTDKINKISLESKKKMEEANDSHRIRLVEELSSTPELVFELFNSQMLPFETHIKAFEFTTKEEAKEFITKETLIFKTRTYEEFLSGSLSVTDLVNMLFAK